MIDYREDSRITINASMTFTLLTESNIGRNLNTLNSAQLTGFIDALENALAEYSCRDGVS